LQQAENDYTALVQQLADYHPSIAIQAAALLYQRGVDLEGPQLQRALADGSQATREAFQRIADSVKKRND